MALSSFEDSGVWLFSPPTVWPSHVFPLPRFSTVTHCHRWSNSAATYFVTEQPPWDGIERTPTGSKSKPPTPCAIYACEMDHAWRRQSKWLGRRPWADQTQVAAAPQAHIRPTKQTIHGLIVSIDARHTGDLGFDSLLRHFFNN